MPSDSAPRCPRCMDGGRVQLVAVAHENSSVFQPRAGDAAEELQAFQCAECGWTMPAQPGPAASPGAGGKPP